MLWMNYNDLTKNISNIDGKTAAILSSTLSCEIIQMVANNSIDKHSNMSNEKLLAFSDELEELQTGLIESLDKINTNSRDIIVESAYLSKRINKIGTLLKSNSDISLKDDLVIAINLSRVSLNGLISLLKNESLQTKDQQIKKELESHIEILVKEDEFYKTLMDSPDY
jgi:formiminotetrahydrofolate cyclodeaminase